MFTFIIVTNRVVDNVTKNINMLLADKYPQDSIMVINYNNYSLSYRDIRGIDYRHIKQSRKQAVNISLPKSENVVILDYSVIISNNFVESLYKHYDFKSLCSLRVDKSTKNGKFVESDLRIGSTITPKSFSNFAIAFNTNLLSKIGETPEETAVIAKGYGVPLKLLENVRTITTYKKNIAQTFVGVTILIPSLEYRFSDEIKSDLRNGDRIFEFGNDPRGMTRFINKTISESSNNCILIINPKSSIRPTGMLNKIRGLFNNKCMLFDTVDNNITDNAWLVIPKIKYNITNKQFNSIHDVQLHILSYNSDILSYSEGKKLKINKEEPKNIISIIIPYMHNGDRWPLFEACIENLYNRTKSHHNIEIVLHECGSRRHIRPEFINLYDLEYMYSEYNGVFHRAWCLNVPSRFMARGDMLVFFDADLIVDDKWVDELLSCDKDKPYIGWGEMINLSKESTINYLKTKTISGTPDRSRVPDSIAAAGGINIIPREIFFNIGGWPESYKDLGYGGEDNSFAFKMKELGFNNNIFKSSVYHLFHGHETIKKEERIPIFSKHISYDKEMWLDHIRRNYNWGIPIGDTVDLSKFKPYINESLLYAHINSNIPKITVCMTNFLRYEILLKSLRSLINLGIPMNIILWVNQSDGMPDNIKISIENILKNFSGHSVIYSKKNMGTGYPRYMMFNKAKYEFDTEYIMTIDDDIFHQNKESFVLGATILDQKEFSDYGAIGLWVEPYYKLVRKNKNKLDISDTYEGFHDVTCLGAATMTFRRDVLDKCNNDPEYIIGLVDWDFSMSINNNGWKLGVVCDPRYKPINDISCNVSNYIDGRWDSSVILKSKERFKNKWGISIS